jgi:hypothetical protein
MRTLLKMLDASRAVKVFVLCLPVALASVAIIVLLNPKIGVDEVAATVAIPLMVSYLMVRMIDWLVSDMPGMTPAEKEQFKRLEEAHSVVSVPPLLAISFIVGAWLCIATGVSLGFYKLLDLSWGFSAAISVLRIAFFLVAAISVAVCIKWLFRIWIVRTAQFLRSLFHFPVFVHHSGQAHY